MAGAARALFLVAALLFVANAGYGLAHEAAHAAVIEAAGGQVYAIYVNVLGMDAYTEHSVIADPAGLVLLNVAGLGVTSLLAIAFVVAGQGLTASFLAFRTAVYAINYAPGTDIATIHAAVGSLSLGISLLIVAVNLACIGVVLARRQAALAVSVKKLTAGLSSFLSRARPARNS